MAAAIFGLIGVLIGGALNMMSSYLADSRAQKRERRTAARLLLPELIAAHASLRAASRNNRFPLSDFARAQWTEHQTTLARLLDSDTWESVTMVYTSLYLFEDERPQFDDESGPELHLSEAALQAEWEAMQGYREAVVTLGEDDRMHLELTMTVMADLIRKLAVVADVSLSAFSFEE